MDITTELHSKIKYLPYKIQEHLLDYINLLLEKDIMSDYVEKREKFQKETIFEAFKAAQDIDIFADIDDVELWQKQLRDEWEERFIR